MGGEAGFFFFCRHALRTGSIFFFSSRRNRIASFCRLLGFFFADRLCAYGPLLSSYGASI